ncbi:hypothetical protein BGX38DRAFT_1229423 [Terfezia claveryi]|nr:hypothetical protein BGX38DRAFT_1229423 [Terfezia claveryi]
MCVIGCFNLSFFLLLLLLFSFACSCGFCRSTHAYTVTAIGSRWSSSSFLLFFFFVLACS